MALHPECRKTGNHDWAYGDQSQWCNRCWLTKPYPPPSLKLTRADPHNREIRVSPDKAERAPKTGVPFARPWKKAKAQTVCCYCLEPFTDRNPPTFDHIIPVHAGGTLRDGWVLACDACNGARGPAPYEDYLAAVEDERLMCIHEDRPFRRPKTVTYADGSWLITIETKHQLRKAAQERKAERRAARVQTT